MNLRATRTILGKELLDTLRDKRTLIMMIGLPIILYPIIIIVGFQAAMVYQARLEERVSQIAIDSPDAGVLRVWFEGRPGIEIIEEEDLDPPDAPSASELPQDEGLQPLVLGGTAPAGLFDAALADGAVDAVLRAPGGIRTALERGESFPIEICVDRTEFESQEAGNRVAEAVREAGELFLRERLAEAGIGKDYVEPVTIEWTDAAQPEKHGGNLLGLLVPTIVVMMVVLGAFYPAVDVTAGEKERGTFETLLATPATGIEIVTGKFLAVFLLAMATGLLNLLSMGATALVLFSQVAQLAGGAVAIEVQMTPITLLVMVLLLAPLSLFVSAVMMSVTIFAHSFKEAQNYATPLFLLLLLPAGIGGIPVLKLGAATQFVPMTNVVLLFRALFLGQAGVDAVFAVFLCMGLYALLALLFAAWLFQREEVVLSEEGGIPLTVRRRDFLPRPAPTPGVALALFALVILLLFYVGTPLQMAHLLFGLVMTEWLLILLPPLTVLWFIRVDLRNALSLRRATAAQLAGALLLGAGGLIAVVQVGFWTQRVLPVPEGMEKAFEALFSGGGNPAGLALLLVAVAVSPAICEEVLFRGAILSGLRQRLGPVASVLVVGLLFGLFHLSIHRLLPTGLLGIVLTYLVLRSGSILPGMMVHFLVNATAILVATQGFFDLEQIEAHGLPWPLLVLAALLLAAGVFVTERAARK